MNYQDLTDTITPSPKSYVTRHGEQRIRERIGVKKKGCRRLADKVLQKGIRPDETTGHLNLYLNGMLEVKNGVNQIRVYGDKIFLYENIRLVTVKQTPREYMKIILQLLKEKKMCAA